MDKQTFAKANATIEKINSLNKLDRFLSILSWSKLAVMSQDRKDYVIIPEAFMDDELLKQFIINIRENIEKQIVKEEEYFKNL